MDFILAAIRQSGEIDITVLDTIITQFYAPTQSIQVGQKGAGNTVKWSNYAATDNIGSLLPYALLGSRFVGVTVRDTAEAQSDWYFNTIQIAYDFYDPNELFGHNPCGLYVKDQPAITDVELLEAIIGLIPVQNPRILNLDESATITDKAIWNFPRVGAGMRCFVEVNDDSAGFGAFGTPLYYDFIAGVYYICSQPFTGSTLLEDEPNTNVGGLFFEY